MSSRQKVYEVRVQTLEKMKAEAERHALEHNSGWARVKFLTEQLAQVHAAYAK